MLRSVVRTWVLAFAAVAALGACDVLTGSSDPEPGRFVGRWDGEAWRGRAYAVLRDDTLHVTGHRPDPRYYYDEYVSARVPFTGPGRYTVSLKEGRLSKMTGGDAGYFPDASGTLVIRSYDAAAATVTGSVELRAEHAGEVWVARGEFDAPVYARSQDVPQVRRR